MGFAIGIEFENVILGESVLGGALSEIIIDGIDTTIPLFDALLREEDINNGSYNIHWLEQWLEKNLAEPN